MVRSTPNKLSRFQQQLYHKAFEDAQTRWAISSPQIKEYAADFLSSLPDKFKVVTHQDLLARMTPGRYVLYGDFHTLKQSQKGLVRLLTQLIESAPDGAKIVLAMEMFHQQDQALLDAYCARKLSEKDFLNKIQYAKSWGFPWKNYKLILDYAHDHDIKMVGINSREAGKNSLRLRDKFMAEQLVAWRARYPDHVIICLVGEYHLADKHLPAHLKALSPKCGVGASCLRIFTNIDRYYFKRPHSGLTPPTEILYLKRDHYCIINSPPWIKWQSYIFWEEMQSLNVGQDGVFPEDSQDEDTACFREDSVDLEFHLMDIARKLADFLKINVSDLALSNFRAFHAIADTETFRYSCPAKVSRRKSQMLHERLTQDGYLFIASTRTVIVSDVTLNNLAGAAGQMLQGLLAEASNETADGQELFYRRTLHYAAGMIASKIFNPRRKGKDILHLKQLLDTYKGRRLTGLARRRRDVIRGVVRFHEWMSLKLALKQTRRLALPKLFARWDDHLLEEITQTLGEVMGYTLYVKTLCQYLPLEAVREIYTGTLDLSTTQGFMQLYRTIMH